MEDSIKSDLYGPIEQDYLDLLTDATNVIDDVKKHTVAVRKAMQTDPVDRNALSNEMVELAIINQRLGDRAADAGSISRAAENHYKTVREEHKVRLVQVGEERTVQVDDKSTSGSKTKKQFVTMSATVADSAKMKLAQGEFDLANAALRLYEQLQFLRKSTDKTIDSVRSKLSYEKDNYKNS